MSAPNEKPKENPKPDILAAMPGVDIQMTGEFTDVRLLPWTYHWPKRILCFIAWKVPPFRWVTRAFASAFGIQNPYCKIVALIRPKPAITGADFMRHPEET